MDKYEINFATLCIVPINKEESWVYEQDRHFKVKMSCYDIVKRSCLFFGSTFNGRKMGSCTLLNCTHKVPIIVEDTNGIIFFPTASVNNSKCIWISYNNLESIERINADFSKLEFKDNKQFKVKVSYFILSNQILRCKRLKNELIKRKKAV